MDVVCQYVLEESFLRTLLDFLKEVRRGEVHRCKGKILALRRELTCGKHREVLLGLSPSLVARVAVKTSCGRTLGGWSYRRRRLCSPSLHCSSGGTLKRIIHASTRVFIRPCASTHSVTRANYFKYGYNVRVHCKMTKRRG